MRKKWIKNWFSNFEPFDEPMYHNGLYYTTVEHFFAAMKTDDTNLREKISKMPYPEQAKKFGKKIDLQPNWNKIKKSVMWTALLWKFRKETSWANKLVATGNWDIVEWNNWHDNYWGNCICEKCIDKKGKNVLGRMLMLIRKKLREDKLF